MAPMVHGLEAKYYGKINFVYLDADDIGTDPFQRELGFIYQPHIFLLDGDGTVLQSWIGFTQQEELEAAFAQYVQ